MFLFVMTGAAVSLTGQERSGIEGIIADSATGLPVEFASIALYRNPDSLPLAGMISGETGEYRFTAIRPGLYYLKVSFIGYQNRSVAIEVKKGKVNSIPPINLSPSSLPLGELEVTARQETKRPSIEKTTVNVEKSTRAVTGNALDILKNIPSVQIGNNQELFLRGNRNILLMIDGKPTTVESLVNIPSASIGNIEIMTNPDARYDAEGTAGIINIVMKKEMPPGWHGSANLSMDHEFCANGGFGLWINRRKWDAGLGYQGRYEVDDIHSTLHRQLFFRALRIDQEINAVQTSRSHLLNASVEFRPKSGHRISFNGKLNYPEFHNDQNVTNIQQSDTLPADTVHRQNLITHRRRTIETTLEYMVNARQGRQTLSVSANFSRNKGSRPSDYFIEGELLQRSEGGGSPTIASMQADFSHKNRHGGKMETGIKGFSRWNTFTYHFYRLEGSSGKWAYDSLFSNDLDFNEFIWAAYVNYGDTLLRKVQFRAGLRVEYNTARLRQYSNGYADNRDYLFPFPNLLLRYRPAPDHTISLSYNRRVTRPSFPQINPWINVVDQLTFETGNKELRPEIADKIEFSYELKKEKFRLFGSAYLHQTKYFITQVTEVTDTAMLKITFLNGNLHTVAGTEAEATWEPLKWITIQPSMNFWFHHSDGNVNNMNFSNQSLSYSANLTTGIFPDRYTEVEWSINYQSANQLLLFTSDPYWSSDISVKRRFFKNRLTLGVLVTDLFNTQEWNILSENPLYRLTNYSKSETRLLWLSIVFRFGVTGKMKEVKPSDPVPDENLIRLGN